MFDMLIGFIFMSQFPVKISHLRGLNMCSDRGDAIMYIGLNVKHPLFWPIFNHTGIWFAVF
jgi:hypothetical protein